MFVEKELIKKEQQKQLERMAMEDNATINKYRDMNPQEMTYKYNSKRNLQRNYRDFEIYRSMKTDEANSYGKFQKNIDFLNICKAKSVDMTLKEGSENPLEIDKMIMHICENRLLDDIVEVQDMRLLTEHLVAGSLQQDKSVNKELCEQFKSEGVEALSEIYYKELEALANKYGQKKLINMSPLDYIKSLPGIMQDFSCIADMQKFFRAYPQYANKDSLAVLDFYVKSWEGLQLRYKLILNGEYKGEACTKYSEIMRGAYDTAKADKIFDKKITSKKISSVWKTREARRMRAIESARVYDERVKKEQNEYDIAEKRAIEYRDSVAKINEHSKTTVIAEDEIKVNIDKIMDKVVYHMDEVTEDNVHDMSENIFKRIDELCKEVCSCNDDTFLENYTKYRVDREHLNSEVTHMIYSEFFVEVRKNNPDNKAVMDIKSKLANIKELYPLFGKIETIMKDRMELIQKYGYTNSVDLTDMQDVTEARFKATENYKKAEGVTAPVSIHDALKIETFKNRLENLEKLDYSVIEKELAACRKVKEFREQQPNFYHLGLSYSAHRRAESMCELLPYYERAYELTLQYVGLKNVDNAMAKELQREWKKALSIYDKKYYRVDNSITDVDYKANEMESYLTKRDKLMERKIWGDGINEDIKLEIAGLNDFISDGNVETVKWEIEKIRHVVEYKKQIAVDSKDVSFTEQQFYSLSVMAYKFVNQMEFLNKEFDNANYADYKIFELRKDVYSTCRQARFFEELLSNKAVEKQIENMCDKDGHFSMLDEIFKGMPKLIEKVKIYDSYAKALNVEYAKANKIKEMKIDFDGAFGLINLKDMPAMARSLKVSSMSHIEKMRIEKLTNANIQDIERIEKEARIRKAVGHEKIANDSKVFMANILKAKDVTSLAGNLIGAPLQLFSWIMHEARTMHGIVNYDECQAKYDEMMATLGEEHAMRTATLPTWQRGSAGYSPEVKLDELFSSQMKKRIYGLLSSQVNQELLGVMQQDIMDKEFQNAMKAIKQYSTIVGIVNTDTTEMEMSFLDMFLKMSAQYLSSNSNNPDEVIQARCRLMSTIKADINNQLHGTLADTISEDELKQIEEKTVSYVESTIYSENMEESNIQDIPLFLHEPNINDVKQSSVGDCWLVSAISSVVRTNPDFIKSMFYDTGDGNVIVRLYGIEQNGKLVNSDRSVLYDKNVKVFPTYYKLRKQYETGWGNASDCTWVQLLEKAYALSGFNGRSEMAIKDNKLYNVVDELTYGDHGVALMHITGKHPEIINKAADIAVSDCLFYSKEFLGGALAGFTETQIVHICEILFTSDLMENQNDIELLRELVGQATNNDAVSLQRLNDNLNSIKNGILPNNYEDSKILVNEQKKIYDNDVTMDMGENKEIDVLRNLTEYFEEQRNSNYTPNENLFYRRCKKAFDNGKTLAVAIPHCVDILDAKVNTQGRRFILLRDPFNIYNHEYTRVGNDIKTENEEFVTVLTGNKENRRLTGNAQDILRYGFRGTSWVELKDLYARIRGIYSPEF